jgi:hypothetical protein
MVRKRGYLPHRQEKAMQTVSAQAKRLSDSWARAA